MILLKASELRLADVVQLFEGAYGTATVKQIYPTSVVFFRPYVATADFSYTGGVICTIGIEEPVYGLDTSTAFRVIERKELR